MDLSLCLKLRQKKRIFTSDCSCYQTFESKYVCKLRRSYRWRENRKLCWTVRTVNDVMLLFENSFPFVIFFTITFATKYLTPYVKVMTSFTDDTILYKSITDESEQPTMLCDVILSQPNKNTLLYFCWLLFKMVTQFNTDILSMQICKISLSHWWEWNSISDYHLRMRK